VGAQPNLFKQRQAEERVPQGDLLGERVGFPRQSAQTVAQQPVEPRDGDWVGLIDRIADGRAQGDPLRAAAALAMLHGLRQANALSRAQDVPTGANPRRLPIAIGGLDRLGLRCPPVAHVGNARPSLRPLPRSHHDRLCQGLLARSVGPGHHEAAGPVDTQTSPASTSESRRSRARRSVIAAWLGRRRAPATRRWSRRCDRSALRRRAGCPGAPLPGERG
jgi:hypothetical protein